MKLRHIAFLIVSCFLLVACAERESLAPVINGTDIEPIPKKGYYKVLHGDTLYSIAWRYGLDYEYLADRNHIQPPYKIHTGQKLYLRGNAAVETTILVKKHPQKTITIAPKIPVKLTEPREPTKSVHHWNWPAHGQVIGRFCPDNHGININGCLGDPIYATAAGKVVYCGSGLRTYGNLIIIKHNSQYLSAYAHNSVVLVKAGDWVLSGQKIAEMGDTGTHRVMLHFEIRRSGQSVNPLDYLR